MPRAIGIEHIGIRDVASHCDVTDRKQPKYDRNDEIGKRHARQPGHGNTGGYHAGNCGQRCRSRYHEEHHSYHA